MAEGKSASPLIVIVVAVARNGVIGRDGALPWRLSTDMKRFKGLTIGKPVVLGRKTFESFGARPLPGRPHVIVTRNPSFRPEGVRVAASLDAALAAASELARAAGADEICVIGGGEIYAQALAVTDIIRITWVEAEVDGDTRFPTIPPEEFAVIAEERIPAGERDSHASLYQVLERRQKAPPVPE